MIKSMIRYYWKRFLFEQKFLCKELNGLSPFVRIGTMIAFFSLKYYAILIILLRTVFPHKWLVNEKILQYYVMIAQPIFLVWFLVFFGGEKLLIYLKKKKAAKAALREAAEKEEDGG